MQRAQIWPLPAFGGEGELHPGVGGVLEEDKMLLVWVPRRNERNLNARKVVHTPCLLDRPPAGGRRCKFFMVIDSPE